MADYAKFLFDAFSAPGDAIQKNRDYAAKLQETKDRNTRDDQRFDYQVKNDDRNYLRQMGIDDANADYRAQSLDLQRRSVERQHGSRRAGVRRHQRPAAAPRVASRP